MGITVNQIVYNYLKNDSTMITAFTKFFYLVNDNKVKQPYATIFTVDDPKDVESICVTDQGQMRFQCDTFTKTFVKGIDKREIYQQAFGDLVNTTTSNIFIWKIDIVNVVDRSETINGLFDFGFEAIVHWERK